MQEQHGTLKYFDLTQGAECSGSDDGTASVGRCSRGSLHASACVRAVGTRGQRPSLAETHAATHAKAATNAEAVAVIDMEVVEEDMVVVGRKQSN